MKKIAILILMSILLFTLNGCTSTPQLQVSDVIKTIEKGKTSSDVVIEFLGSPTKVVEANRNGEVVWEYDKAYEVEKTYNKDYSQVISTTYRVMSIKVLFDNEMIVQNYSTNETYKTVQNNNRYY